VHGGSITVGHPFGMTGVLIIAVLIITVPISTTLISTTLITTTLISGLRAHGAPLG
jgi:acetyl-CoA acetyltransferase